MRHRMDLDDLVATGIIMESYLDVIWQDVEYVPEGKVACHLGHLNVLRRFLESSQSLGLEWSNVRESSKCMPFQAAMNLITSPYIKPSSPLIRALYGPYISYRQ